MSILTELVCFSASAAIKSAAAGAGRVELCAGMPEGGTTPSAGEIKLALKLCTVPVFIMIRPRGGDFLYSPEEIEIMKEDILFCKSAGAKGVVFGILNPDGSVNVKLCKELVQLASPMEVTFHRAFDMCNDPFKALEDIIECGFNRILTSGLQSTALSGVQLIRSLVEKAAGRIIIMPGGGIRSSNVNEIINTTSITEVHTSARSKKKSGMLYHNSNISMGGTVTISEYETEDVDDEIIKDFISKLK